jgi:choline dehydrogenase
MENDLDIQDDFHGTEGPMPVRRRQSNPAPPIQSAFREACIREGFGVVEDTNGVNSAGVGVAPTNNLGGVRVSTAIAYLSQVRHRLNLTVRGEVHVRRILFENSRAVGVEAESGGEIFTVEAEKIVLSSGALRSPQLLMLSGVGPKDHLEETGIPVIRDVPGVGQGLWNHLSVHINFKVKDGVEVPADLDAPHYRLIFTAPDSELPNDMVLSTVNVVDERDERVAEVRTQYRTGDVPPGRAGRISCTLGVPRGSGYVRLSSSDPGVQPSFNYRYLQHPEDLRRVRESIRFGARLLESEAYQDVVDHRITPTDETLADDEALNLWMRQTVGTARHVSGTCRMGPDSDPMTVVDQYCRVKGMQGLWVTDASVVPQLLRGGGLHTTVIMIAERVVDWIAAG